MEFNLVDQDPIRFTRLTVRLITEGVCRMVSSKIVKDSRVKSEEKIFCLLMLEIQ